jgi:hypothetical protein
MAHFAQLDENNTVTNIIVVNNEDIDNLPYPESEPVGIAYCQSIFGEDTIWKQTSYNRNFRRNYAFIGGSYYTPLDVFIEPQPFSSWSLDENGYWRAPVPRPTAPEKYVSFWDEEDQEWFFVLNQGEV